MLSTILYVLGALTAFSILKCFSPFILSAIMGSKVSKKSGDWAVVTGATDGIGKAYCEALAQRGFNIVLISRTLEKLQQCAEELQKAHKVETKVVAADFGNVTNPGFVDKIAAVVDNLQVGILINNVGKSYEYPRYFAEDDTTGELLSSLVDLNVHSTSVMSKLILPGMTKRKGGIIINLSSAAGVMTCGSPMLAGYSASKAYVSALSKSIQYEVGGKGIVCQTHAPYFVTTNMSKIRKTSLMVPSPKQWVKSSLNMVGYGGTVVVPFFWHFLQDFVTLCVPEELIGWYTCNLHNNIRTRALKKAQREAEGADGNKKQK